MQTRYACPKKSWAYWPKKQSTKYERRVHSVTHFRGYQIPWDIYHPTPTLLLYSVVFLSESPQNCIKAKSMALPFYLKDFEDLFERFLRAWIYSNSESCFLILFSRLSWNVIFSFVCLHQTLTFSHLTLGNIIYENLRKFQDFFKKLKGKYVWHHGGIHSSSIHSGFLFFCA